MSFIELLRQIQRPWWSPQHPSDYIASTNGVLVGWGRLYPDYIGAYNLIWALSGVDTPPRRYSDYAQASNWIAIHGRHRVDGKPLTELAALNSLTRFERKLRPFAHDSAIAPVLAAVQLRIAV